jgi:hypothetical protein
MSTTAATNALKFAFDRLSSEYVELSDIWKQIDSKAQATATVAGIFIAASFAFVRNAAFQLNGVEKLFLAAVLVCLILSILLAVGAMVVRNVPMPPEPESVARMVEELLACPETEYEKRHAGILADTINAWLPVNRELRSSLGSKANKLAWGQRALLVAAVLMACLTVLTIGS